RGALLIAAQLRPNLVETRLLLVAERLVEFLKRRPHLLHGIEGCLQPHGYRLQASRWRHWQAFGTRLPKPFGGLVGGSLQILKQRLLIALELNRLCDPFEWPCGHTFVRLRADLTRHLGHTTGRLAARRRAGGSACVRSTIQ